MASARLTIRLTARAGRDSVDRIDGGTVHVRVRQAPSDGAANAALIVLLADALATPKSGLAMVAGHRSRLKVVEVATMDTETAMTRLLAATDGRSSGSKTRGT